MKALVVGDGGREHAIAWKLASSPSVERTFVAPGNAGTALEANVENVALSDPEDLAGFAADNGIALTVVGPEGFLAKGIVDLFRSRGLRVVGPTREAAQLETSKSFAKQFMARKGIPTARYGVFDDRELAREFIGQMEPPFVLKADGLAAGKGVAICQTEEEAGECADEMLGGRFGAASERIVIEEHLEGEEVSFFALSDGDRALALTTGRDYKRLLDGDAGPNTGGMGAVSPAPISSPSLEAEVMGKVVGPTIAGMRAEGRPYTGFLYVGLMVCADGPRVLEYNCRMGDPECQVVLPRMRTDFAGLLSRMAEPGGTGDLPPVEWEDASCVGVVLATEGYATDKVLPGRIGKTGKGLLFHARTVASPGGDGFTHAGGRALCAVGSGKSVPEARELAYRAARGVEFPGGRFRNDIADGA